MTGVPEVYGFQGQGTQKAGNGAELAMEHPEAREVYDIADDVVGPVGGRKFSEVCFEGPEELVSENAQLAIFAFAAAVGAVLQKKGKLPTAVAGHSIGEYGALLYAGVFGAGAVGISEGVKLVKERQAASAAVANDKQLLPNGGNMVAVNGLDPEGLARVAAVFDVDIAAQNTDSQGVLSGPTERNEAALKGLSDVRGVRPVPLPIPGPFHSRWMVKAAELFRPPIEEAHLRKPNIPFFAGSGRVLGDPEQIRIHLIEMLTNPVRFNEVSHRIAKEGIGRFTEIGVSGVLSKFVKRTVGDSVETRLVDEALAADEDRG